MAPLHVWRPGRAQHLEISLPTLYTEELEAFPEMVPGKDNDFLKPCSVTVPSIISTLLPILPCLSTPEHNSHHSLCKLWLRAC
jgi:hypothetical protein